MIEYLKRSAAQAALCLVMSAVLSLVIAQGFRISPGAATSPIAPFACSAVVLVACFATSYNTRSALIGVPGIIVGFIAFSVVLSATTPTALFADEYENTALVWLIPAIASIVIFLLTRKKPGIIVAGVAGCLICGAIEFLYGAGMWVHSMLWLACCVALYAVKNRCGTRKDTPEKPSSAWAFAAAGLALCLVPLTLAAIVYAGIVHPLNPPTQELKLITEYYSLEEVRVSGMADWFHKQNDEIDTKNEDKQEEEAGKKNKGESESQGTGGVANGLGEALFGSGGNPVNGGSLPMQAVRYFQEHPWMLVLIPLALVVICLAVVLAVRMRRSRRLRAWLEQPGNEQAMLVYRYLCHVFELLKMTERGGKTPFEYERSIRETVERFEGSEAEFGFHDVTATLVASAYGGKTPSKEALQALADYYCLVPKRCMAFLGPFKYLTVMFRI